MLDEVEVVMDLMLLLELEELADEELEVLIVLEELVW
jgi:hypothetical protein